MTAPPITIALVAALAALDQLASALAPRLAVQDGATAGAVAIAGRSTVA